MGTRIHYMAGIQDIYPGGMLYRAQTVRYCKYSPALHHPVYGFLDQHLRFGIELGRGLIQYKYR